MCSYAKLNAKNLAVYNIVCGRPSHTSQTTQIILLSLYDNMVGRMSHYSYKVQTHVTCNCLALILVLGLRGVLCAIICPLILTLDPCRGPIGDWKNLGRHSRCGAERCYSRWRPRWPPHPYFQHNSTCICPVVMNLVSLSRYLRSRNPLKSFSGWKT